METRSVTSSLPREAMNSIAFTAAVRDSLETLVAIAKEAHGTQASYAQQTAALLSNAIAPYRDLIRALDANRDYCAPAEQVSTALGYIRTTLLADDQAKPDLADRLKNKAHILHQCVDNNGVLLREHVDTAKQYLIRLNRHIYTLRTEAQLATS